MEDRQPSPNIIVSFSINSESVSNRYEHLTPASEQRLIAAEELQNKGWRIRIRLDPIILENGLEGYEDICRTIAYLKPEQVTIGSLRQYVGLFNFAPNAPRQELVRASDGRMRYPIEARRRTYEQIAEWLGFQPSLCKETKQLWGLLGWQFNGCNCTTNGKLVSDNEELYGQDNTACVRCLDFQKT